MNSESIQFVIYFLHKKNISKICMMIYKDKWTIKNKESLDELGNNIKYDNVQPGNDRENVLTISKRVISSRKSMNRQNENG
jgi:hypothetical protein